MNIEEARELIKRIDAMRDEMTEWKTWLGNEYQRVYLSAPTPGEGYDDSSPFLPDHIVQSLTRMLHLYLHEMGEDILKLEKQMEHTA